MHFKVQGPLLGVASYCEPILYALPDWFGVESSVIAYGRAIDHLPTFLALGQDENPCAGFLAAKQQNPHSVELYALGIRPEFHRQGIGRQLLTAAETWMRSIGIEYAYVKTLGPSRYYEPCERTRQFYQACGYRPLEEFKHMWADDPCLLMVKRVAD